MHIFWYNQNLMVRFLLILTAFAISSPITLNPLTFHILRQALPLILQIQIIYLRLAFQPTKPARLSNASKHQRELLLMASFLSSLRGSSIFSSSFYFIFLIFSSFWTRSLVIPVYKRKAAASLSVKIDLKVFKIIFIIAYLIFQK